jgi:hypothetical protein
VEKRAFVAPASSSEFSAPPGAPAASTLLYHSCHSEAERGGGICDTTSREKWSDRAEKQVRPPCLQFRIFSPHPAPATSTLLYHSCHSEAERGGGICDTTSREKRYRIFAMQA